MIAHYYNTNHESGITLIESEIHNKKQEDWILQLIFQKRPTTYFSREDIEQISGLKEGSVSRSLANLTEDCKIEKTHNMRVSSYGKQVHTWILAGNNTYYDEPEESYVINPPIQLNLSKPPKYILKVKKETELFKWMGELK